jgi:hypothetical protein
MYINSIHALCGINIISTVSTIRFYMKSLIHNMKALHNLEFKKDQKLYIKLHSPVIIYRINVMNIDRFITYILMVYIATLYVKYI